MKYKCELLLDTKNEIQLQHFYFLTRLMQLRQFVVSTFSGKPMSERFSVPFVFFMLSALADLVERCILAIDLKILSFINYIIAINL